MQFRNIFGDLEYSEGNFLSAYQPDERALAASNRRLILLAHFSLSSFLLLRLFKDIENHFSPINDLIMLNYTSFDRMTIQLDAFDKMIF